ncbi:F-box protein SKIP22-like [Papaver somniferum]|uniref:F-box protein SKIP22-like n=1 Tax=Papaver somniferum TaxID=3469 RepID=UPI000E700211|nr:F-box protein SKIP22-like [Papaver somniferum]
MVNTDYENAFLKKIVKEEVGNIDADYKLLIISVHAVFLESGFVAFESNRKIDRLNLCKEWSESIIFEQKYTLPSLLSCDGIGHDSVETLTLIYVTNSMKDVQVYVHGPLEQRLGGSNLFMLCLGKSHFIPSIRFVCFDNDEENEEIGCFSYSNSDSESFHQSRVFEFWKITKDNLALPLLIELCYKTGLTFPPSFMILPMDIKLKILGFLRVTDIANMACVSKEMKHICSNNGILKQKIEEEFKKISDIKRIFLDGQGRLKGNVKIPWERRLLYTLECKFTRHKD